MLSPRDRDDALRSMIPLQPGLDERRKAVILLAPKSFRTSVPAVSASVQRHREKVLAQAEQQLRSIGKLNSSELIQLYKKFLKTENYRLHLRHKAGEGGRELCTQRASLVDVILRHLLDAALQNDPTLTSKPARLALVATGGYGRGELNPYSDVDVLFLTEEGRGGLDPRIKKVIEQILY